ncbi:hypothetical protein SBD_0040 [Streptomyces bottropensis ATCC 25435]|uniref:Uncharacterized protein n=1 Tax=Streptomyces bottropensis ATCC 25435 TaxID=1054862 RepID=M3F6W7_9ACTN|nr:hypothetical protein SBD_0040 [Streptomyces bottropensis ATCC 25435]
MLLERATLPLRQTSALPGPVPTWISYAVCLATGGTQLNVGAVSVPSGATRELTSRSVGDEPFPPDATPLAATAHGAAASGSEAPAAAAVMMPITCLRVNAVLFSSATAQIPFVSALRAAAGGPPRHGY